MKLLLVAPSFPPDTDGGGPTQSLKMIAEEAAAFGADVVVLAPPGSDRRTTNAHDAALHGITVVRALGLRQLSEVWRMRAVRFDHVVVSSFWSPVAFGIEVLRLVRVLNTQDLVLTPRGQLNPGPLLTSRGKKALALPLYRFVARKAVDRFVATSPSEQVAIRAVLGREADLGRQTANHMPFQASPPSTGALEVGFISRVHPRKGLLEALHAMSRTKARINFHVAGPIQDETYWQACVRAMDVLNETGNASANYLGLLDRPQLQALLSKLDVMVLVSSGENFGHSIAEALQAGVRVIVCTDTPWTAAIAAEPEAGAALAYPLDAKQFNDLVELWAVASEADRRGWRKAARQVFLRSEAADTRTVTQVVLDRAGWPPS